MAELIDRADLLAEIQLAIEDSGCVNHERDMMDCIRYAPTIDAVQVVHERCSNCANLVVQNTDTVYALCPETGIVFRPFALDTRTVWCERHNGQHMDADAPERAGKDGRDG